MGPYDQGTLLYPEKPGTDIQDLNFFASGDKIVLLPVPENNCSVFSYYIDQE